VGDRFVSRLGGSRLSDQSNSVALLAEGIPKGPGNAFPGEGKRRWDETKVAQLERRVGQQAAEIDF
jgi:hypothetical protein